MPRIISSSGYQGDTRYNNYCCAAAERVLAGATGTLHEILEAVDVDYNDRLERAQQF
jgi:hypothetical protein